MKYSIWIIPPPPLFDELNEIIHDLSSKYQSPIFTPHMTVLGSVDEKLDTIQRAIKKSIVGLDKLSLSLGPVSFSTTYFQSVFVRINSTAHLMNVNLGLKKHLHVENNVFMPHISLLYGNHDMELREKITREIKIQNFLFVVHKIDIIQGKPEPSEWKSVATVPLIRPVTSK